MAQFPAIFKLSQINGVNGFRIDGVDGGDHSGVSVSPAGDVNGDGFDDLIIGASGSNGYAGAAYVVFGSAASPGATFQLSALNGTNGFAMRGGAFSIAGFSVSSAGDVNGDGFGDVIVGMTGTSSAAVVFGKASGFPASLNLGNLNGSDGFILDTGIKDYDAGWSVSSAGDINGDGFADILVGAPVANFSNGAAYVVFGKASGFPVTTDLQSLNGSNGFKVNGTGQQAGYSVRAAGDVNGDGFDDIIVGSRSLDAYVVFGKGQGFSAQINVSSLNGSNGFAIVPRDLEDLGFVVSAAGDMNGDGYGDLVIGTDDDIAYAVFGRANFSASFDVTELNGKNGFKMAREFDNDLLGICVSFAGDVNGDGFGDIIVGELDADPHGTSSGVAWVVFGKAGKFDSNLNLSGLDGNDGFKIEGVAAGDLAGHAVSAADLNNDGFTDLIVGALKADPNGLSSGQTYVIYGVAPTNSVDRTGSVISQAIHGGSGDDSLRGLDGDDTLTAAAGDDTVFGGADKDRIFGGDGDDRISGGSSRDLIDAGNEDDRIDGGSGNDFINAGAGDDIVDGSSGNDRVVGGTGSDHLAGGSDDDVLAGGEDTDTLTGNSGADFLTGGAGNDKVDGGDGNDIIVGGDGRDTIDGGRGDDIVSAGAGNDSIDAVIGVDKVEAGSGNDIIDCEDGFITSIGGGVFVLDSINGGGGTDEVTLNGDYSAGIVMDATTLVAVETLRLSPGGDYPITVNDGNVAANATLTVLANSLHSVDVLTFDGAAESDGHFVVKGGAGDDTIIGGAQADTLYGGEGSDTMTGGGGQDIFSGGDSGHDIFVYAAASESTGDTYDIMRGFSSLDDRFDVSAAITGVDVKVTVGTLSHASFDSDMALAIDAAHLAAGHAVLFNPSAGELRHHNFLIVDLNAVAGYQAGEDLVIELSKGSEFNNLSTDSFI